MVPFQFKHKLAALGVFMVLLSPSPGLAGKGGGPSPAKYTSMLRDPARVNATSFDANELAALQQAQSHGVRAPTIRVREGQAWANLEIRRDVASLLDTIRTRERSTKDTQMLVMSSAVARGAHGRARPPRLPSSRSIRQAGDSIDVQLSGGSLVRIGYEVEAGAAPTGESIEMALSNLPGILATEGRFPEKVTAYRGGAFWLSFANGEGRVLMQSVTLGPPTRASLTASLD